MNNFKRDLTELLGNNKEHLAFTVSKMATLLEVSEDETLTLHFDKVIEMFIATV